MAYTRPTQRTTGYYGGKKTAPSTMTTAQKTASSTPTKTAPSTMTTPKITRTAAQKAAGVAKRRAAAKKTTRGKKKTTRGTQKVNVMGVANRGTRKAARTSSTTGVRTQKRR